MASAAIEVAEEAPTTVGGFRREDCRDQFRRYCQLAADSGFRRWAQTLVDLPD
jgi:tRNA(adenine34) deaminase